MKKKMETQWLQEALLRRKAQESSVVLFQSTDPERVSQFTAVIESSYKKAMLSEGQKIEKFLVYDPFTGLTDTRTGEAVKVQSASALPGLGAGKIKDISTACDALEQHLKLHTTLALIKGLSSQKEPLQYALRAFATAGDIYKTKSTVFIFAPTASAVLDDYTKDLAVIIDVPISLEEERRKIADKIKKELGIKVDSKAITASAGLSLHDTESAFLESVFRRKKLDAEQVVKYKADVVRKTGILEIETPRWGFSAVGGYEPVKRFVKNTIIKVLQSSEKAQQLGLTPPRGVLFFGPPGTGKTLFARTLATEINLTFCNLKTENIFTSLVGETERKLRNAIKLIEAISPSIVFIDECERLGTRQQISTDSGTSKRFLSQLLSWLGDKERKAIVVLTANMPEQLDPALLRAGRLDYLIPILYPNESARLEILKVHTSAVTQGGINANGNRRTLLTTQQPTNTIVSHTHRDLKKASLFFLHSPRSTSLRSASLGHAQQKAHHKPRYSARLDPTHHPLEKDRVIRVVLDGRTFTAHLHTFEYPKRFKFVKILKHLYIVST